MKPRQIGRASIVTIEDTAGPGFLADKMFPKFDPDAFAAQHHWLLPEFAEADTNRLILSIHSWLVRTPHNNILIDTCLGNHKERPVPGWNNLNTPYLARLRAAGVAPEEIDFVMCTHLHVDHVGWNTELRDGRWVPTFPNARYLFAAKEYAYWEAERKRTPETPVNGGSFDDSVLPVVEAGRAVLIGTDYQTDPLFTIRDAPGHTPGSITIELVDGGSRALFTGDIMHHPIQVYRPDWSSQFCWDPELSARTRRQVLEHCAEHNDLLCPAHFPGPNAGYIRTRGDAFEIQWDRR